ncbi:glycosyltransferase family protein [Ruania alba]|uniref:Glycosyltransferase involved in cell wall bisynthesis n=1 Tax=Ruania alba TaxID=648782 RepID=A0A1H5NA62_9MICO|nr:glycosyltransferase [Ruania alba]SEE98532.1 Glycosyltransferase involved in cell wall bisynthesis [Ruania alba]
MTAPSPAASSRPLRVLVVTVVHDPEDARIRHRQIPALLAAGMQVTYAAPFEAFGRTPPSGVRGIDVPRASGRRRLGAVVRARQVIRRAGAGADVVLVHDPDLLLSVTGLGPRVGRVVWDVHEDTGAAIGMREWIPDLLRRPLRALVRLTEQLAERRYTLLLAEHSYAERFRTTHPVVPNSNWVPATPPQPSGTERVVYLGNITIARGGREMITLARLVPELELVLIGTADATIQPELEAAQHRGELTWLGFVPNDDAVQLLDGALAGLALLHDQPNYSRSLPTKIAEYLAHGVPAVTTPNESSAALVRTSGGGVVVPFGDVLATAAALRELARDPERRRAMAISGYRYVAAEVNWHRDGAEFAKTIADVARR